MTPTNVQTGYATVNGLKMYYEIHGSSGHPLVLLHGAFSAIGSSFGTLLPELAKTRQVIGFEYQAHGRTAYDSARDTPWLVNMVKAMQHAVCHLAPPAKYALHLR